MEIGDRVAHADDLDTMVQIEASAFPPSRRASRESILYRLKVIDRGTWLGLIDGAPAAFANGYPIGDLTTHETLDPADPILFDPVGKVWLLRNVSVHQKFQRLGLGKRLIQRQIEMARAFGAEAFRFTATENLNEYYSSQGFSKFRSPEIFHGIRQSVWNLRL